MPQRLGIRLDAVAPSAATTRSRISHPQPVGTPSSWGMTPVEQIVEGTARPRHLTLGIPYSFRLITVPLRGPERRRAPAVSRQGQLALSLA